jgi:hypothetical protein
MKASALALLVCLGAAWAQTTPPAAENQAERLRRLAAEAASAPQAAAPGGPKLPDLPNDAVIAVFDDGTQFTMGDLKRIVSVLPPQSQQVAVANAASTVQWWAGMRKLARMAEAEKLDQISPTREQLEVSRTLTMGQAMMNSKLNTVDVDAGDIAKYYEANKEQYKQVRVKALYLAFGDATPSGKPPRTDAQAKEEADKLLAQIRAGADFVKLVNERSDDQTSREKDGDFATFHKKDNIPDALSGAVFSLKQGEVSEPIRQPNGYYLLRAEEVSYVSMSQAQAEIIMAIRGQRYTQWLEQSTAAAKVQFPNPAFPGTPGPAGK